MRRAISPPWPCPEGGQGPRTHISRSAVPTNVLLRRNARAARQLPGPASCTRRLVFPWLSPQPPVDNAPASLC
eukprot:2003952-Pyramimonas_sp.AAC.1